MFDTTRPRFIHDSLYGKIELPPYVHDLLGSRELLRLCGVSHCALPLRMARHFSSDGGSKYVHTRGVTHLAIEATRAIRQADPQSLSEKMARLIIIAALWHDAGTPPFSHITEKVMRQDGQLGCDHEEWAAQLLPDSHFARAANLTTDQVEVVQQLVVGRLPPYSDLIHGVLDLDTLDGVLRFATATGYRHRGQEYKPVKIARAFRINRRQTHSLLQLGDGLDTELEAYQHARATTWDLLFEPEHRSPESMLHRAIELAAEEHQLPARFYGMTDEEALAFLLEHPHPHVRHLVEQAIAKPFPRVFEHVTTTADTTHVGFTRVQGTCVPRLLWMACSLPPECICAYSGPHGRAKSMRALLVRHGDEAPVSYGRQRCAEHWGTHVFLDHEYASPASRDHIQKQMNDLIAFYGSTEREPAVVNS